MTRTRKLMAVAIAMFALGSTSLVACGGDDGGGAETAAVTPESITIELKEENASGQTGTATLRPNGNSFDVDLEVTPPKKFEGEYQRAHVHDVACADYRKNPDLGDSVTDELNDLANGESSSTVYAPLGQRSGSYSINVHEQNDPFTVVACGDIPRQ